jgi:O-methyltransferase
MTRAGQVGMSRASAVRRNLLSARAHDSPTDPDRHYLDSPAVTPEERYLDLLKRCLTRSVFGGDVRILQPGPSTLGGRLYQPVQGLLRHFSLSLVGLPSPGAVAEGDYWPTTAETMIGPARLDNIENCVRQVIADHVPGDLIETGVWRGGGSILMRAVLAAYADTTRLVWVADSFEGLPRPTHPRDAGDEHWRYPQLAVSIDEVRSNFARYGLLDHQVRFLQGWFADTLPSAPIDQLAVLRLDGDMYSSTLDALEPLYPKVSPGGFVIVDDYSLEGCRQAVDDYRARNGVDEDVVKIDHTGVFWRKRQ